MAFSFCRSRGIKYKWQIFMFNYLNSHRELFLFPLSCFLGRLLWFSFFFENIRKASFQNNLRKFCQQKLLTFETFSLLLPFKSSFFLTTFFSILFSIRGNNHRGFVISYIILFATITRHKFSNALKFKAFFSRYDSLNVLI